MTNNFIYFAFFFIYSQREYYFVRNLRCTTTNQGNIIVVLLLWINIYLAVYINSFLAMLNARAGTRMRSTFENQRRSRLLMGTDAKSRDLETTQGGHVRSPFETFSSEGPC